jgi:ectoine hydroxylase-related dioxygenase (phytanoyl-CoA dioxygenase family)
MPLAAVTPDQIEQFRDQGFLSIAQISTAQEIEWMRGVYQQLFEQRVGWDKGDLFDFAGTDSPGDDAVSPQLLSPSDYVHALKDTVFRRNAHAIARQLLGANAELVYEHAMLKPARTGGETPWHQDEAFFPKYTNYQSITFWMPLQAVDPTNGCLDFIPGSNNGDLLPHRRINQDPRIHGLEAEGPDAGRRVACPLAAGDATIHHQRTLHHAGPNLSDRPRCAYALGFGVRSKELTLREEFPWNIEKATARHKRAVKAQGVMNRAIKQVKDKVKGILL